MDSFAFLAFSFDAYMVVLLSWPRPLATRQRVDGHLGLVSAPRLHFGGNLPVLGRVLDLAVGHQMQGLARRVAARADKPRRRANTFPAHRQDAALRMVHDQAAVNALALP